MSGAQMRNPRLLLLHILCIIFLLSAAFAGYANIAPTPPMGWNSWDSYGQTIDEQQFKSQTDWMAKNLRRFGWRYVVVDEGCSVALSGAEYVMSRSMHSSTE